MWLMLLIGLIIMLFVLFLINFYKDPKRDIPTKSNLIVAPADGKIIRIIDTSKNSIKIRKNIFGRIKTLTRDIAPRCYVVSIFMSPLDAHINRAPIDGTIKSIKYQKGRFFAAYDLEKSFENEKNEIIIQNSQLKVKVIQTAGFLERRIKCYVKKEQKVNKGHKIGMIALSSQTTLVLPIGVEIKVKIGQSVKAGETVIAAINQRLPHKG